MVYNRSFEHMPTEKNALKLQKCCLFFEVFFFFFFFFLGGGVLFNVPSTSFQSCLDGAIASGYLPVLWGA